MQHRSRTSRTPAILALLAGTIVLGLLAWPRLTASMKPNPAAETLGSEATAAGAAAPDHWIAVAGRGHTAPEPAAEPTLIALSNGIRFDTRAGEPPLPAALKTAAPDGEAGFCIVQFAGPIEESWKQALGALGGRIHAYLPNYAFVVKLPAGARPALAASPAVRWIGAYQPAYKLSGAPEMAADHGPGTYMLQVFDGEPADRAEAAIAAAGGRILERSHGRNQLIRFELGSSALAGLAAEPAVAWIEPWHQMKLYNSSAQWVVQTFQNGVRRVWDMGIRGEGQVVSTCDSGIRTTHNQFFDALVPINTFGHYPTHRKLIAYLKSYESNSLLFGDEAANSYHGTHTGGTIAGDDSPNAADARDGMALKSKFIFLDGGNNTPNAIFIPADLNDLFILPYTGNAGGAARIMSNSWGSDVAGDYDFQSMTVDQFMWDHKDFLLFFSNGNAGGIGTVGTPATAKDCVSVGATGNGTAANTFASFSSGGPADDGRLKPTLCAPGSSLSSAYGGSNTTYQTLSGTSMSSPAAAGAAALIRQYLTEGWYPTGVKVPANGFTPSAALLKAMAINSSDPAISGYVIPSNNIGWGRILDDNALYFAGDARKLALVDYTSGLLTGDRVEFQLEVVDAAVPLVATLVWTDYASTPSAAINIVNNLNLTATVAATTYRGNVFSGGQSTTGGAADVINVEECVRRNAPQLGLWTFRIDAANVPFGPQPFALVVTGGISAGSALIQLDKPAYGGADVVGIRVTDPNGSGPLSVTVTSTTETSPETVSLAGGNGIFTGSIPITLNPPAADGRISVSDGDVLTVTYVDALATTLIAQATINLSGPAITNVHAGSFSQDSATITWTTSSPANSKVYYGTTPSLGQETALDPNQVTSHALNVPGLAINQTYYFDVESYDNQGNGVRDDNGGLHYTLTTDTRRDVLLVIGDSSFDKRAYYDNALGARGWSYTVWEGGLAEPPRLGNLDVGMRSFKAVVWQTGLEQYPMVTDAARDSLAALNAGGARWTIFSHDVAWDFSDPTSPDYNAARLAWFQSELKAIWQADPATFSSVIGYAGDPISGAYTGGIFYTPHRSGAAGDEINPNSVGGTSVVDWRNNDASPDDIAVRFVSSGPLGTPGNGVWGGQPTRIAANFYEWAHLNVSNPSDATRADVLDKTLIWLIGHDHPDATVSAPNGGETFTGSPVSVSWTEAADAGYAIASRALYYSSNGGEGWNLITSSPGTSPYSWDITGLPNGNQYRVRVVVVDNGSPALNRSDASNSSFTLNVPGGDVLGPIVVAGSIAVNPNPIRAAEATALAATVTDATTGNSNVTAAEWSSGPAPAPAGTGTAMSGAFGSVTVAVSATIPGGTLAPGQINLWVRGRDAGGVWGNATRLAVQVNGASSGVAAAAPGARFALAQNAPNPFNPVTAIRFSLTGESRVELSIYDVAGRNVRTLVADRLAAGPHEVAWDGRDDRGAPVASGLYFYKLVTPERTAVKKMVMLK